MISLAAIAVIVKLSIRKERIQTGATAIVVLLLVLFPFTFFSAGGFFFCCWVRAFSSSYIRFRNMSSTLVSRPTIIMENAESKKERCWEFTAAISGK